jgi:hypothetical protein
MSKMNSLIGLFAMMALASENGGILPPAEDAYKGEITGVNHTGKPFEPTVKPPYKRPKQFKKKRHV